MEILYIIIFILTILVIYLIYKTRNLSEKFDVNQTPTTTTINQAIADTYKVDLDAMRNLGQLAQQILTGGPNTPYDTLNIPATNTKMINLEVSGDVKFTNKNSNILEIFPKFMVIAWASSNLPNGWALCDGNKYSIGTDGSAKADNTNGTQTPDLRGRFILGAGTGVIYDVGGNATSTSLTQRNMDDKGGEEKHKLTPDEMPPHSHNIDWSMIGCKGGDCANAQKWTGTDTLFSGNGDQMTDTYTDPKRYPHLTSTEGGFMVTTAGKEQVAKYDNNTHNNMPPFYVLYYIMKL